jgi:3-deoxy-D-manno-octulosonic-acid transferase
MTRLLYSLLMRLALPFVRRKLRRRGVQEPGYLEAVEARFGRYEAMPLPADGNTLWVHAVSLGETRAAAVLIERLRERLPGMRLLLTHGTATGRAEGASLLRSGDIQTWQPWDTPGAVQRFLAHFRPRIGILMETELWPNLSAGCQQAGVPLVLANARLSAASLQRARRLAWLARPAYRCLAAVWAQTQDDAARLRVLGANVQGVFGNLKFDATPNAEQLAAGRAWRRGVARSVVMLASSREGEDLALLQILESFKPLAPVNSAQEAINIIADDIQWLIVPRHPQRFDEVAALIQSHGFAVSRRSAWGDGAPDAANTILGDDGAAPTPAACARPTIWLGDSLGEMALYYGLADVALLGGSFEPLGGQNLIEAAACACPLLMGPHTFNFAEVAELAEAAGAALRLASLRQAVDAAQTLVHDPVAHAAMVSAAAGFSSAHRGAVEKTVTAVLAFLTEPAAS